MAGHTAEQPSVLVVHNPAQSTDFPAAVLGRSDALWGHACYQRFEGRVLKPQRVPPLSGHHISESPPVTASTTQPSTR